MVGYDLTKPTIVVYLLFLDSQHLLFAPFLKRGFGHVTIAIETPEKGDDFPTDVLVLDTSAKSLNCYWIEKTEWLQKLEDIKRDGIGTAIKVTKYVNKQKIGFPLRIVPGCTALANYALGFSNWTFTPWSVYKKLLSIRNRRDKRRYGILDIDIPGT